MEKNQFMYEQEKINKTTIWILFLFFGWSYGSFNKMGMQILYWITLGGFGIWWIYVLFTLNKKVNNYNLEIANKYNLL